MKLKTVSNVHRSLLVDGALTPELLDQAHEMAWETMERRCSAEGYSIRGKVYFVGLTDVPDEPDQVAINFECETSRHA
jgi:hypothetical protein